MPTYLWMDDVRPPPPSSEWFHVYSVKRAKAVLIARPIEGVSLDHDMGHFASEGGDGIKLVLWMCEFNIWPTKFFRVHSMNPVGARNMIELAHRYAPAHLDIAQGAAL